MRYLPLLLCCIAFAADPEFTKDGHLVKPKNYREWIFLSSGMGMNYGSPEAGRVFDNVFVEPSAYRKFVETGHWPDKTVFALELRRPETKGSINKGGQFQTNVLAVEFAVKDVARFKGEWAYFGFGPNVETVAAFPPTADCYACHSQNGAVENTFVQFYPTLIDIARAKGTLKASYLKAEGEASPH
jgi:hypothetical protein